MTTFLFEKRKVVILSLQHVTFVVLFPRCPALLILYYYSKSNWNCSKRVVGEQVGQRQRRKGRLGPRVLLLKLGEAERRMKDGTENVFGGWKG